MSWHFSRAMAAGYLGEDYSVGSQFAPLSWTPFLEKSYTLDKTIELSPHSRYGTTFAPLTADLGMAWWMSSLAASRVSPSAPPPEGGTTPPTSGRKCSESSERLSPDTSSQKTCSEPQSGKPPWIFVRSATRPASLRSMRPSWLRRIAVSGGGWLPTPTAKANHDAPSMRKWPAYATYQDWLCGRTCPRTWEFLMGWPAGWTDSAASATDSFRSWLSRHGAS